MEIEEDTEEEIESIFSEEEIDTLFEILENLPNASTGRNDPCVCGSGLKYKKCCLSKTKASIPAMIQVESFKITSNPLTPEEAKNDFPPLAPEDNELLADLFQMLQEDPASVDSEDCEYFQKLNALQAKYPENPMVLNYIIVGYNHLGQKERVRNMIAQSYEKFPNYLFARIPLANFYLRDGFPDKALEILDGAYTLKQMYPERTVFHLSEVRAFSDLMARYFCYLENFDQAKCHIQILQQFFDEDDEFLIDLEWTYKRMKVVSFLKRGMQRLLQVKGS